MNSIQNDSKSLLKLSQLYNIVIYTRSRESEFNLIKLIVDNILADDDINVNCKVTINTSEKLKDCTALHFLFHGPRHIYPFTNLLERGADFTIKNAIGQTALHSIITSNRGKNECLPFINSVLSAHVKFQISVNPRDNDGISHLHGACIANNVEALELFIENGASIDEAVNLDAKKYAGYTPMHFAVEFLSYEVAQILVSRGANINAKNALGLTPLDILMKRRLHKLDYVPFDEDDEWEKRFLKEASESEAVIELLLNHQCHSAVGISNLHAACTLKDLTIAERLLDEGVDVNYAVPLESPVSPGYTALHFAVNRIETIKMLVIHGAKMDIENAEGKTPLDFCMDEYNIEEACNILTLDENWKSVVMSDEKTRLLDIVRAMKDLDTFKLSLKNNNKDLAVPNNSMILPGCTILHLAVIFSTTNKPVFRNTVAKYQIDIVKECFEKNLGVNTQNAKGQTFIHLAFTLGKYSFLDLLLNENFGETDEVINLVDKNNLSHLHIACALRMNTLVERFLNTSSPNVAYIGKSILMGLIETGMTPLHVATICAFHDIVEMLLANQADLHATDKNGMAPIHYLLKLDVHVSQQAANMLFTSLLENLKDQVVNNIGLSYLHAACYCGHAEVVEKLINLGSNVNASLSNKNVLEKGFLESQLKFSVDYIKITPLFLAQFRHVDGIMDFLLRNGADFLDLIIYPCYEEPILVFLNNFERLYIPLEKKTITHSFMLILWDRPDLQIIMQEKLGLTKLHIACHMKNEEAVKIALNDGINVNSQVKPEAQIFAGCTPLHLLFSVCTRGITYDVESIIELLLHLGADITIANTKKNTPIHVFSDSNIHFFNNAEGCKDLILNAQQDFKVNPVNAEGMSHFHIACTWHKLDIIEKFLETGSVDVNQPTGFWTKYEAGLTPLHLALNRFMEPNDNWDNLLQTVDLLLKNGADIDARDVRGATPSLKRTVLRSPGFSVLNKLLRYGASMESKNVMDETIFDTHKYYWGFDQFPSLYIKYAYPMNSWNNLTGEGCIAKLFLSQQRDLTESAEFRNLIELSDVTSTDKWGRSVIHNCVANRQMNARNFDNHVYVIESFMKKGVNIDHQDESGQTALHYAVRMENEVGIFALLACGIDINVTDNSGKTAFCYILMECNKSVWKYSFFCEMAKFFYIHVKKLQYLKLEVSDLNTNISPELQAILRKIRFGGDIDEILQDFISRVETTKNIDVGVGSLTVFDFLNETGGVSLYPYLAISEQCLIDEYFTSIDRKTLSPAFGVTKLQFHKMKLRLDLIGPALNSLRKLLGFSVPGLCEEIARFLANSDLKKLIACIDFVKDKEDNEIVELMSRTNLM